MFASLEKDKVIADIYSDTAQAMEPLATSTTSSTSSSSSSTAVASGLLENAIVNYSGALLDVDAYAFVALILESFSHLNNAVIQKFVSIGNQASAKWEFTYLRHILSSRDMGDDAADVIKELLDRDKSVSRVRPIYIYIYI